MYFDLLAERPVDGVDQISVDISTTKKLKGSMGNSQKLEVMTNAERTEAIKKYLLTHKAKKEWQPIKKRIWGVKCFTPEQFQRIRKRNKAEAAARLREYKERSIKRERTNV